MPKPPPYRAASLALLVGFCAAAFSGCGCTLESVVGLVVHVNGGGQTAAEPTGMGGEGSWYSVPCEAQVTVSPSSEDDLECHSTPDGDCSCRGLNENKGKFEVTVSLSGRSETKEVRIRKEDRCHVATEQLCFFGPCPEEED